MKYLYSLVIFFVIHFSCSAQYDSITIDKLVDKSFEKNSRYEKFAGITDSLSKASRNVTKYFLQRVIHRSAETGDKKLEALALNSLGLWYLDLSLYSDAYKCLLKAEKKFEENHDTKNTSMVLSNFGNLYYYLGDYEKALSYQLKGLKLVESESDSNKYSRITDIYLNMGTMHGSLDNLSLSRNYFLRALEYYKLDPKKDSITRAYIYNNIATTYVTEGDLKTAEKYEKVAFDIKLKYGDNSEKAHAYRKCGELFISKELYKEAKIAALKALALCDLSAPNGELYGSYDQLARISFGLGDYKEESKYLKLGTRIKAYLDSAGKSDEISNSEIRTELMQKSLNDSLQNLAQIKVRDIELLQKKKESYYGIIALVVVCGFAFVFFRRYKLTQKQKQEIEFQKSTVDLKNKEITESINYAKNVQDALMPDAAEIEHIFKDSFVTYIPKDIVAGDFYWWHDFSGADKRKALIAVADCTGHGVPGAMVSVVCINALNRAVNEFNLEKPNEVLDKVNMIVNETFSKNRKHINDGMDISMLFVDYEKSVVNWTGANNRLIYFKDDELIEVKPDKQAIGKSDIKRPFTVNSMPLVKETIYYLLTDGFHDQFGGDKNKKLGIAKLRSLLIENHKKPMSEQALFFEMAFKDWKNKNEQTDDVTLIGIKI